jgi:hypothetical protein bfra3_23962
MSFKVIPTPTFAKSLKALAKRHRSLKEDVKAFVAELERDPLQGVELTAGIRKISMAIKSKGVGKSGGARVITYNVLVTEEEGEVYLLVSNLVRISLLRMVIFCSSDALMAE